MFFLKPRDLSPLGVGCCTGCYLFEKYFENDKTGSANYGSFCNPTCNFKVVVVLALAAALVIILVKIVVVFHNSSIFLMINCRL